MSWLSVMPVVSSMASSPGARSVTVIAPFSFMSRWANFRISASWSLPAMTMIIWSLALALGLRREGPGVADVEDAAGLNDRLDGSLLAQRLDRGRLSGLFVDARH